MKVGMLGVVNNLSTRMSSHNAGWTLACKSALKCVFRCDIDIMDNRDDYDKYDVIVINEGVNFKPLSFNFFGGVQQRQIDALVKLSNYKNTLYSINNEVDYNYVITKRKELKDYDLRFELPIVIDLSEVSDKLILGDSHSLSVYRDGYAISRNDGKTLHGFLTNRIESYLKDTTKEIIFYAGNIDIRFHVHRFGGKKAVKELCIDLYYQVKELTDRGIKVTLTHVIPAEDESRKLPSTGLYKGEKFYGTQLERLEYIKYFNSLIDKICNKLNINCIKWDFNYEKGLSFDDMEARQSVHIRPSSYKYITELL